MPPHAVASTSDDTATAMVIMPPTSTGTRRALRWGLTKKADGRRNGQQRQRESSNAKSQRQPVTSTNQPPSSGPTTVETANTGAHDAHVLAALARRDDVGDGGLGQDDKPAAAEAPATARPATRPSMLGAKAHTVEPHDEDGQRRR